MLKENSSLTEIVNNVAITLNKIDDCLMPHYWAGRERSDILNIIKDYADKDGEIPDVEDIPDKLMKEINSSRIKNKTKGALSSLFPLFLGSLVLGAEIKYDLPTRPILTYYTTLRSIFIQKRGFIDNTLKIMGKIEKEYGEDIYEKFGDYLNSFEEGSKYEHKSRLRNLIYLMKIR